LSVADLKGLSKAAADVIRQLEQKNPETGLNSTPTGDSVSEPVPNSTARADVLPAAGGEPVACSPTIPPKRRRRHKAWLKRFSSAAIVNRDASQNHTARISTTAPSSGAALKAPRRTPVAMSIVLKCKHMAHVSIELEWCDRRGRACAGVQERRGGDGVLSEDD
jgi:hypothetical protein